ncbi:HEPN domain-containing protein [Novosphingobium sp. HR1a]|uniref:HEPN domain-containing protein n=1 Tax=Novosphingobium sp. HR1a TaxID=1395637 RepID=UPI001B3C7FDD|nr:HEPN domain-containing protein [Novosphingobium sp. HR1a]MBF7010617.1 hypothetical protein [Novosphingobium sp. HR1a]
MARSNRFKELRRRLRDLRKHMLPHTFSPTGDYTSRQQDRARGYRLLAHAEIEAFMEEISISAATRGVSEWVNTRKVSDCLFCLITHYHHGFAVDEIDEEPPFGPSTRQKAKDGIKEVVNVAMQQYRKIHGDNHGVREKNLLRLMLPIGIRKDDLDPLWITNLDSFGRRRGDLAHQAIGAQQAIDPRAELQAIEDLLVGLEKLDGLVQAVQ